MLVLDTMKVGDDGLSAIDVWYDESIDEAELGYRKWPRVENVGVTGEGMSDGEEFWVYIDEDRSISESAMLSLFLRSSTNCGSKSGLSLGDMVLCSAELRTVVVVFGAIGSRVYRAVVDIAWCSWGKSWY